MFFFSYKSQICAATTTAKKIPANIVFDTLKQTPGKDRLTLAYTIYKTNFRRTPAMVSMANLDTLYSIAINLNDKDLQCSVYDMRADYYSVNKGFNDISTAYYKQAISFAKENDLPVQIGRCETNLARYYFIYKRYVPACEYFLQAQEVFKRIGYANVPNINDYLARMVNFYYALGDYDNAMVNLKEGLKYIAPNSRDKINILNTIGLVYRNYKQYPEAINYFNKAMNLAVSNKDTVWVGIAKGNIGSVYFMQKQYAIAQPYIETDYAASLKYKENENACIALLRLIKINIDKKNIAKASIQLDTAQVLLSGTHNDELQYWTQYYDLKAQMAENTNNPSEAITYRKIFEADNDSLVKRDNLAAVERVKLRYETDRQIALLNKVKQDEGIRTMRVRGAVVVLVLLVIFLVVIYNRQQSVNKKDKALIVAEKRILDEQLKNADNALRGFTENLRQKNQLIENFKTEIEHLHKKSEGNATDDNLEKLLQSHIATDENWIDFKKLFSKVYPGFFVSINKNYPNLSSADTRLLALIKLGLSNSEMAEMLGITVEGVKKAKQRLRKKIDPQVIIETSRHIEV